MVVRALLLIRTVVFEDGLFRHDLLDVRRELDGERNVVESGTCRDAMVDRKKIEKEREGGGDRGKRREGRTGGRGGSERESEVSISLFSSALKRGERAYTDVCAFPED